MTNIPIENLGIFCPSDTSSNLETQFMERGIANLQLAGFNPIFSEGVGPSTEVLGLAGTEVQRATWFNELIDAPSIHSLMSFWGGLNTASLLDHLDLETAAAGDKPVVGYSDTTSLLLALYAKGFEYSYYGPAFISFAKQKYDTYTGDSLNTALLGNDFSYHHPLEEQTSATPLVINPGSAEGRAIAGNLDSILSLNGTNYAPDYDGSILFIEDAEYVNGRRLYRHMTQLYQSGITQKVAALCIGIMTESSNVEQATLEEIVELTVPRDTPVISNLAFGHTDPIFTIPIGRDLSVEFSPDSFAIDFNNSSTKTS